MGRMSTRRQPGHQSFSEGGNSALRGVEIFESGTHRDKPYTTAHLDEIAANFKRFSSGPNARLKVPAVLGHEETQEFLERSDLPAAAWPTRVWRKGGKLLADFDDIPPKVAKLLKGKAYRTVSSEIYDEPPKGIPGKGKCLRRIAFLGGSLPQLKTLDEIGDLIDSHAERFDSPPPTMLKLSRTLKMPSGAYACFSEVTPMDREQLMQALAEHGCDMEALASVPEGPEGDAALAEMLRVCEAKSEEAQEPESYEDEEMPEAAEGPEGEDDRQKYGERARKYFERAKKWAEKYCGQGAMKKWAEEMEGGPDDTPAPEETTPMPKQTTLTHKYSEADLTRIVEASVKKALGEKQDRLAELEKFAEKAVAAERTRAVDAILDELARAGKMPPAEHQNERELLLSLDAQTVHKFSEGGKTTQATLFDRRVAILKKRPSTFGDRFATAKKGAVTPADDEEVAKVQRFCETNELFRHALEIKGETPDQYVEEFRELRKKNKRLTAEEYGVPSTT